VDAQRDPQPAAACKPHGRARAPRAGPAWRANPQGTYAQTGGIDGRTLVIQLIRGGTSKLAEIDLGNRK
jgi:hypothetical protein